ncbi:MAG: cyclohexanecarboxylate-CoA ligase [Pseudonocardiales bacterium]|jgi:cyclohexanecarboxylate-CoA ligase|nr:cyclohexanecarboxylate-CoA ligase [Pseudonocardiales bacterium]
MLSPTRPHVLPYDLPDETLADRLRNAAAADPSAPAVVDADVTLSYSQLLSAATAIAGGLRARGVGPGDRVMTQLPNLWEAVAVSWGVFLAGGVLVPVVPIYRAHELRFIVEQTGAAAVVAPAEFRGYPHAAELRSVLDDLSSRAALVSVRGSSPGAEPLEALLAAPPDALPSARAEDIAVVLYTSGTTAAPKGALHSSQTLLAEVRDIAGWCGLSASDHVFMASPLSHITGLSYGIVLPVDLGCSVVLQDRWNATDAVRIIESNHCTFTVSATPFLRGLTEAYSAQARQSNLRIFVCGGADIPAGLVRSAHALMGTSVVRTYGSTELPTSSMADPFGDLDVAADGEGVPMGRNEMALRAGDGGVPELVVRGPELFLGYLDPTLNEAAFTADGYFRTGDQATFDADGTAHITGRIKDIINRGGEKFSVAEVEAVLLSHPAVADVAVVGYPDPVLVERACAVVVPAHGLTPTVESLRSHLVAAGLAVQKAPELLVLVEQLPRTASGKVQRFRLREQVRAEPSFAPAGQGAPTPTDR